jgi:hypothetical protein
MLAWPSCADANIDAAAFGREFDRIVHQIPQHLLQPPGVRQHPTSGVSTTQFGSTPLAAAAGCKPWMAVCTVMPA